MSGNVRYCAAAPYCVTSLNNVDADCAAAAWGGWTMANQLYVKSGESPHVTLAGKEESALPKHFLPKYLAEKVIDAL